MNARRPPSRPAVFVVIDNADGKQIGAPITAEQIDLDKARGLACPQTTAELLNAEAGYDRFSVVRRIA